MTTPAQFGTPYRLIRDGMTEAGLLGRGRDPTSDHLGIYMNKLNDLFYTLQVRPGLKLWLNQDLAIDLQPGVNLYTLGPTGNVPMTKPIRAFEAYFTDTNANRRPLIQLGRSEWDTLSTVVSQGAVNNFFVDKQQLSLNVYVWQTPDQTAAQGTMHLIITQQVQQLVALTDLMNFPVEWYLTLMWNFAAEICTGQPQAVIDRCEMKAQKYLEILEDWDVEDASTTFTTDTRIQNMYGRFR